MTLTTFLLLDAIFETEKILKEERMREDALDDLQQMLDQIDGRGRKYDSGKPMCDLFPLDVLVDVSKVLTIGAEKYSPNNWRKVEPAKERYTSALLRHLSEFQKNPIAKDSETGHYHITHVVCNAVFLCAMTLDGTLVEQMLGEDLTNDKGEEK